MAYRELFADDYLLANGTLMLLAPLIPGTVIPPSVTLTTSAAAVIGAVVLSLTVATTIKLYADAPILFGTQIVTPTADVAIGATSIPVAPLTAAIASGATATTFGLAPVYSIASSDTTIGDNLVKSRNLLSGLWETKRVTMRTASLSCSGTFVLSDPGFKIIKDTARSKNKLYFELVEPDGNKDKGSAFVTNYSRKRQADQNIDISFTLDVDGQLFDVAA